jgi:hypothetical protein
MHLQADQTDLLIYAITCTCYATSWILLCGLSLRSPGTQFLFNHYLSMIVKVLIYQIGKNGCL